MNDILRKEKMPEFWKEVNIKLIPKEGQEKEDIKKLQTYIIVK